MNRFFNFIILILSLLLLQSCGIFGLHFNVHNPKKPGKIPDFDRETVLLGELTKLRSCYDVHYYDLDLEIIPSRKMLKGKVIMFAKAKSDFDSIQLDLDQPFKILDLVDYNSGDNIEYSRDERAILVKFPHQKGDQFAIEITYEGKPVISKNPPWKGGFVWKQDHNKKDWFGVACESDGASLWWPLKDHTSDEPDSMRLHYTVPDDIMAIGNGQLEGVERKGNKNTYHWHVTYPINTYNVTVYGGDFKLISDTYIGIDGQSMEMNHYVLDKNYEIAKEHFQQLHPILKVFEEHFGSYPFYRDGFKLVESPYMGMEHQTAIAYGSGYKNDLAGETDYIILHETAHEWWGNSITAADLADVWLQEGFATYSEAIYLEETVGSAAYESHMQFYKWVIKNKYPVVGVTDRRWFHFRKNGDVYMKGAWILHTLRSQINNDDVFFDLIKTFGNEFKYKIISSKDFINLVEKKTGESYQWFFNQYLYNNQAPELEFAVSKSGKLYFRWSNTKAEFNKLNIEFSDGDDLRIITPGTQVQSVVLRDPDSFSNMFSFSQNVLFATNENKALLDEGIN